MRRFLLILISIIIFICATTSFAADCGDVNSDTNIDILDIVYLINYKYKGGADPDCGPEYETVTDIDGNIYKTITIGDQVWMMENLKVRRYRNGDLIPTVTDDTEWAGLISGACCEINNVGNVATYGRLYNWDAVDDSRNIAPEGWHVPTHDEWQQLVTYLGGESVAGGKIKETGTEHWDSPNTGATNESDFTALPGGYRTNNGNFDTVGGYAYFWSISPAYGDFAWMQYLVYYESTLPENVLPRNCALSVRCVKD